MIDLFVCSSASCVTWTARVKLALENQTVTCARCHTVFFWSSSHIFFSYFCVLYRLLQFWFVNPLSLIVCCIRKSGGKLSHITDWKLCSCDSRRSNFLQVNRWWNWMSGWRIECYMDGDNITCRSGKVAEPESGGDDKWHLQQNHKALSSPATMSKQHCWMLQVEQFFGKVECRFDKV